MKSKIIIALCMILVMSLGGCGSNKSDTETPLKIFKWISNGEDNCINPHDSSAVANYEIVDLIQVSLYDYAPAETRDRAILIPALADGEPMAKDSHTWIIKINPNAKFSNGEEINAHTFIYSWKMGLDPKLAYNSTGGIASGFIEVENAIEYYSQMAEGAQQISWDDVGFKAVDSHTLEIKTTQRYTKTDVMRHFAARVTSPVYEPLYEAGMNAERTNTNYGTELKYFVGCGPFTLTTWVKSSERVFEKNDNFINSYMINIDGITSRVVTDEAARLELFEKGESDYVALGVNGLLKYAEDPNLDYYDQKTIRTIEVNRNNPKNQILTDPMFRKALYYAIDRNTVAKLTNTTPAPYFLSSWATSFSDGTTYRSMDNANSWLPENNGYNPELAKQLFEEVMEKWNLDKVSLSLTYSENIDSLRAASEYLQKQLTQIFGEDSFELTLQAMQHTAALALMRTSLDGDTDKWDLCWSGWNLAAETFEPYKKFAPYRSFASNRYANYSNSFIDDNYDLLTSEEYRMDEQLSFELTVELEKSLILTDVTCIPVFQEKSFVLYSERMRLCVDSFVASLGYGWEYCDIETE